MLLVLWTLLWSSGVICVIATVSLTPSLSTITLCNKQTVLIIVSTCSALTCHSVFRHLHFTTSIPNVHSTARRAMLSGMLNISFCRDTLPLSVGCGLIRYSFNGYPWSPTNTYGKVIFHLPTYLFVPQRSGFLIADWYLIKHTINLIFNNVMRFEIYMRLYTVHLYTAVAERNVTTAQCRASSAVYVSVKVRPYTEPLWP